MKPFHLCFIMLCSISQTLFPQPAQWLTDDDYSYVFRSEVDYFFAEEDLLNYDYNAYQNQHFRLKVDPAAVQKYNGWLEDEDWLWEVVFNKLEDGTLMAYQADNGEAIKTTDVLDKLVRTDTVLSCFMTDFDEEPYHFITTYPQIKGWRLYLNWAWNEPQKKLESELSAIAPIFRVYNDQGEEEPDNIPLFLRMVTTLDLENQAINDPQWAWVGQAKVMTSWHDAEVLKGKSSMEFTKEVFYQQALVEKKIPLYNSDWGWWPEQQHTADEIDRIQCQTDTLYVMDPKSFEIEEDTYTECVIPEELHYSRLYYRLYFNPTDGVFGYKPISLQVVREKEDDEIGFLYYRSLFLIPFE